MSSKLIGGKWTLIKVSHMLQKDNNSCGVLIAQVW